MSPQGVNANQQLEDLEQVAANDDYGEYGYEYGEYGQEGYG